MPTEQMTIYPDRETLCRILAEAKTDDRKAANMAVKLIKEALAARDRLDPVTLPVRGMVR